MLSGKSLEVSWEVLPQVLGGGGGWVLGSLLRGIGGILQAVLPKVFPLVDMTPPHFRQKKGT